MARAESPGARVRWQIGSTSPSRAAIAAALQRLSRIRLETCSAGLSAGPPARAGADPRRPAARTAAAMARPAAARDPASAREDGFGAGLGIDGWIKAVRTVT